MSLRSTNEAIRNSLNMQIFYIKKANKVKEFGINIKEVKFLDLTETLRNHIKDILNSFVSYQLETKAEADFSIDDLETKHYYFRLSSDEITNFNEIINSVNNLPNNRENQLRANQMPELEPNMYIIKIIFNGNPYYLFKNYSPVSLLKRLSFFNLEMEDIDASNFITIKRSVDCLFDSQTSNMYIFNKSNFETLFNYKDDYEDRARLLLQKIRENNLTNDIEFLEKECLRLESRIKQLARIYVENKLEKLLENFANIQNVINSFELNLEFNGTQIILHADAESSEIKKEIDSFLKLLDLALWENAVTGDRAQQSIPQYNQMNLALS